MARLLDEQEDRQETTAREIELLGQEIVQLQEAQERETAVLQHTISQLQQRSEKA